MKTLVRLLVTVLTVVLATALQARNAFGITEFAAIVVQDIPFTGPDGPTGLTLVGVTATAYAHAVPNPAVEYPYNQETFAQIDADGGVTCLWWVPWGSCYYSDTASGTGTADDGSYFSLACEQNDFDPIYITIHATFSLAAHWNVSALAYMTFWGPICGDYFQPSDYQYGYGFGWITGAAVEVGSLQYKIGTGSWAGVSGVITVPQGTTVSFQAIPKPADAGWPSGKPAWNPSSDVTFNTPSTSATNYQDVSAECGNTVTAHVLVVGVEKLQYLSAGTFVDVPGTLYVLKGSTVTFKAIPTPGDAGWPSGKPAWGGVASGSGQTTGVTFATASTSPTDYKIVSAECGNVRNANVVVIDVTLKYPHGNPAAAPDSLAAWNDKNTAKSNIGNEVCYDSASPGVCAVECEAGITPTGVDVTAIRNQLTWKISNVGSVAATWSSHVSGDSSTGLGITTTATFTGLPAHNADFGSKTVTLTIGGSTTLTTTIEVFFDPNGSNNPGPAPLNPPEGISESDLIE